MGALDWGGETHWGQSWQGQGAMVIPPFWSLGFYYIGWSEAEVLTIVHPCYSIPEESY